ncbi:TauD/TfdA family dioxygenase [Nocardia sp. NPDC051321]|uniref:TauD/TfdA family dioxygenase n=1 Tax=Nocardia sp. NPDC051321 TaxID=3364323 RepID=UPI0037B072F2
MSSSSVTNTLTFRAGPAASAAEIIDMIGADGYAYVDGIPNDFDHLSLLSLIGIPVPQYQGELVRDIKPDPQMQEFEVSALNMKPLVPHTELFEFAGLPPRYIALWAVVPAHGPGGETTLTDGYELLRTFTPEERAALEAREFEWRSPASLTAEGVQRAAYHPIAERTPWGTVLRYSGREMRCRGLGGEYVDDPLLTEYRDRGLRFFEQACHAVKIARGALLVWDNWRMYHSRSGFCDPRRHLRRVMLDQFGAGDANELSRAG